MDAKTRGLLLLAVLLLVCAYFALAEGRGLFGTVFFTLSVAAVLSATQKHWASRLGPV